ncbi:hypothetical protein Ddye_011633 [Dipteronia dyeriana]|uniref:Uncharacterized protein n=1 Tax=Dipteronia dyeriana TaxID=168575 RepID=A0AAE0CHD1_9ROSI|nr:hypothetical protein Ddye_011633 [Dipteronia dyeriana]
MELQSLRISCSQNITDTETKRPTLLTKANPYPQLVPINISCAIEIMVLARGKALVPINFTIVIPVRTYTRVALSLDPTWKHSMDVRAGVIDPGHKRPIGVSLFNDRIVQLIFERIMSSDVLAVEDFEPSAALSRIYPCIQEKFKAGGTMCACKLGRKCYSLCMQIEKTKSELLS